MLPTTGYRNQFIGPGTKFLNEVINDQVNAAILETGNLSGVGHGLLGSSSPSPSF